MAMPPKDEFGEHVRPVRSVVYKSVATITRPADTNAYDAGDVAGAAAARFTFLDIGPSGGGPVLITSAKLRIDLPAVPSGMTGFRLALYSAAPPSDYADRATWDLAFGDRSAFQRLIDLGTPADLGSTLWVEMDRIDKQVHVPSGGALSAYLITLGAFTGASETVHEITLYGIGL